MLVLDEATNALDSETETCILKNIRQLSQTRIIVMVNHRLAGLAPYVDKVYLIEQGRVAEESTYSDLMAKKGIFYSLVRLA